MNRSIEIETEWISLAPKLASSGYLPVPYRVPEGYFQGFYDRLIMLIRTEEIGGFSMGSGTSVEEDPAAELEALSPLLAGLSRKTPYSVPDNYFAQFRVSEEKASAIVADFDSALPLETSISESAQEETSNNDTQAPVIRMKSRRSWTRLAAAAVVTAVILTGAFFYFRPAAVGTVANELAKVSDQDMENFIVTQDLPEENVGDSASLQADLNTAPASFSENDISDLMSNVSDTELEAYAVNEGQESNLN